MLAFVLALLTMPIHCQQEEDYDPTEPAEGEEPPESYEPEEHGDGEEDHPPSEDGEHPGLSGEEYPPEAPLTPERLGRLHAKIDTNGDGKVSLEELVAHPKVVAKAIAIDGVDAKHRLLDSDGDGKVSLEEHMADHPQEGMADDLPGKENLDKMETERFKGADKDGDGFLNIKELEGLLSSGDHYQSLMHLATAESLRQKDTDNSSSLTKHEFWEQPPPGNLTDEDHATFERLDRNKDGVLDLEELKAWESGEFHTQEALREFFQSADKNKDGHMTPEEMSEAHKLQGEESEAAWSLKEWAEHWEL